MSVRTTRTALGATTAVALSVALAAPAVAAPDRAGHDATSKAIQAAVDAGVPGVTATARDGHDAWSATAGVGNLKTGKPRSADDRFRVGSITKTFVATVLLQLEAEGRLSLDDTVEKWLPGRVRGNGHDGNRITLRQLLNHTSGIYNYTADEEFGRTYFLKDGFFEHRYDTKKPGELVALAMTHKPDFEPGTSWNYSNTNFVLAGMVIEKATGRPYGDAIRERIVKPLHLTATSVPGTRVTVPQPSSRAYSKLAETATGPSYDVTKLNPSLAYAAGEMISNSTDLNRFYSALLRGKLLPREQLAEMTTTVPLDEGSGYGLGLMKAELSCGVTVWGHGGGIHGSISEAITTKDGRHSLAFNLNGDWAGDTEAVIEAEFCGKEPVKAGSRAGSHTEHRVLSEVMSVPPHIG
ncbi:MULTISPECIES: serine hydrolase domain-containing protein [unclassified Streptomyces]|uniref:serine hydrolase domain-containing protein n=1 Tax=unclassified Streptomyces TaxID=2593676 RepID=UPI00236740CE|nr:MULTISPECIES: serine hydrolase domain-containing protein [unclassified Streptomyces]MDF3147281.1 serine hydrolase [Streptomyces sp. T21Q-yed]WDF38131.1 serine hydrolase [Streptomyces sp. T12]